MKKSTSIFFLSALSLSLLASCSPTADSSSSSFSSSSSSSSSSSQSAVIVEDAVYLGLFASSEYSPALKGEYKVTSSDETLAKYEDGKVLTYDKEGSSTITFATSSKKVVLTVHVNKDATLPIFTLEHEDISLNPSSSYELPYSLVYGSRDVTSYLSSLKFVKESGDDIATLEQKDSKIVVTSKGVGVATYTIGAEFMGHLLSSQLIVTVKEDQSFFIYGEKMHYDDEGCKYEVKLVGASSYIDLAKDLKAKNNGADVPYSSLSLTLEDNDFATLDSNGRLSFSKVGSAKLTVKYLDYEIVIRIIAYKEVDEVIDLEVADRDFSLEKEVTVSSNGGRTYSSPNKEVSKTIEIPSNYGSFLRVDSLYVENEEIIPSDESYLSFDASKNALKMDARLFDASIYGLKTVSVVLESEYSLVKFNFKTLFITKAIGNYADFTKYISQKNAKDTIIGYFVLSNDIDANGDYSGGSWTTTGWDYAYGFRGTLDGRGFAIKNMKAGQYGLSGIIGSGALIQDINFENLTYVSSDVSNKYCLFARGMKGATFRNIDITLSSSSVTDVGEAGSGKSLGLFTVENAENCQFEFVKVNAAGFSLLTLVGKQASNTTYSDCEVICKSLKYVYADVDVSKVSGIKVSNA